MHDRHATALKIVIGALGLGALGDFLFHDTNCGVNAVIWTVALLGIAIVLFKKSGFVAAKPVLWLAPFAVLFSIGFVLHDSPGMWLVNALGLGACTLLLAGHSKDSGLSRLSIAQGTVGLFVTWLTFLADFFILFVEDIHWKAFGQERDWSRYRPVVRGALIAVPLLLVFGGLMSSADAMFRRMFTQLPTFDLVSIVTHGGLFVCFAAIAAAILRRTLLGKPAEFEVQRAEPAGSEGSTEATIVMGSLITLFALFVGVQFRYFFGGQSLVLSSEGMNYSQYARQGFFELVAISALALPVLLTTTNFARRGSAKLVKSFSIMAGVMVSLLVIVMTSAVQRMLLYIGEYGLSELRLYTTAFMVWLAIVYAVYCLTTLVGKETRFTFASLVAGLGVGLCLNFMRPGDMIAHYNTALLAQNRPLDVSYLTGLGADAVPQVLAALPKLPKEKRTEAASWLLTWEQFAPEWRGFNYSRARAYNLVKSQHAELAVLAPTDTQPRPEY